MKKIKNNSMEQEIIPDAAFKAWPFSSDFNFAWKDGQATAATYKYYCPLVVNPIITNIYKEFYLKCGRVPRSVFQNVAMHENIVRFWVKTSPFSYCFEMWSPSSKVTVLFCYFFQYDEVFLISLLDGCYHYLVFMDPVNGCWKSKLLIKE